MERITDSCSSEQSSCRAEAEELQLVRYWSPSSSHPFILQFGLQLVAEHRRTSAATGPGGAVKSGTILHLYCSKVLSATVITAVQLGHLTFSFDFNHLATIPGSSSSLRALGCSRRAEGICQPAASAGKDLPCH